LKDTFEEQLQKLIRTRAHSAVAGTDVAETRQRAPVVDIMAALRKSLEAARKPVKSEMNEKRARPRRARR
jgi:non-homologous end joining protein Ku